MEEYLSFEENVGWTVKKEGLYYFSTYSSHEYSGQAGVVASFILLNGSNLGGNWTSGYIYANDKYTARKTANSTIYLTENDVIDYSFVPAVSGIYSTATFYIYAMFE